ncbi:hypothetical protein, partial [Paenibacillus cisolokensis]|uniref:hypothetical protein n=1 Tax=Paenibacillus cisolokensis TaxID=1658519 RepID=UPI001BCB51DD
QPKRCRRPKGSGQPKCCERPKGRRTAEKQLTAKTLRSVTGCSRPGRTFCPLAGVRSSCSNGHLLGDLGRFL